MPLKYLSNSWRSLEMPLIHCKVKLKPKWKRYRVLSAAGNNVDDESDNIIFDIKDAKLHPPVVTLSETIKNYKQFSAKDLKG